MPDKDALSPEALTSFVRQQITLYPEKFGVMGTYSREMLRAETSDYVPYLLDQLALKLTTSVMCGQTYSDEQVVKMTTPESWWDHAKLTLSSWHLVQDNRWKGREPNGTPTTPPPWMVFLWPFLVLWPRWYRKHPVKYATMTGTVKFEQRILYPDLDHMPAQLGRPVIYETMDLNALWEPVNERWGTSLRKDPSRFLNRHEIASEIYKDPQSSLSPDSYSSPWFVLNWLERHGVNVDQLVKRR